MFSMRLLMYSGRIEKYATDWYIHTPCGYTQRKMMLLYKWILLLSK